LFVGFPEHQNGLIWFKKICRW